ncbi:TPA: DUF3265 domain-containing protein, partial [Vibrio vulnificus]|nr:DUF3265 domain-containing protein [Vibrio vulnificus]
AVVFGDESGLREVGLCGIHPLTQRYATRCSTWRKGNGFKLNITICSRLSGDQYDTWTRRNLHRFKHYER